MAKVQKAILTEYTNDGSVVISNIRKGKAGLPVIGSNETYSATLVTEWYDGSPMDDSKVDGAVYLKYKGTEYPNYTGSYFRVNLPNFGELFLEKDTVAQMRVLSSTEILLLKMGYYKGVKLNGYYESGDTPAPIQYYLSDTTESDDGGSVFEVGGIKLEHEFVGEVDVRYFGLKSDYVNITTPYFDNKDVIKGLTIFLDKFSVSNARNPFTVLFTNNNLGGYATSEDVKFKGNYDIKMSSPLVRVGNLSTNGVFLKVGISDDVERLSNQKKTY